MRSQKDGGREGGRRVEIEKGKLLVEKVVFSIDNACRRFLIPKNQVETQD